MGSYGVREEYKGAVDEAVRRTEGDPVNVLGIPSDRWVMVKSYARLHPIEDSRNPEHAPTKCVGWHIVCRIGASCVDEYGNKVDPILDWRECPE